MSKSEGVMLGIPSVYKSMKHLSFSFVYDAPKIWNDNVRSATSLNSFSTPSTPLVTALLCDVDLAIDYSFTIS